ncbi:MAG: helix-turn-helix transcriptional regulator [Caldisericaceae bacterium]|nr:helix-turn-helix transcriptional regulator [Caldisericaceae bacterium]
MEHKTMLDVKEDEYEKLGSFFSVFSDPTRLKIIVFLLNADSPSCVTKIANVLSLNQPAVSQQMRVLRNAGLVKTLRDGKFIRYSIADEHVLEVINTGISHIKSF